VGPVGLRWAKYRTLRLVFEPQWQDFSGGSTGAAAGADGAGGARTDGATGDAGATGGFS